jgi:hypothetical protein
MWDTVSVNTLQNFSPPNPPPPDFGGLCPLWAGGGGKVTWGLGAGVPSVWIQSSTLRSRWFPNCYQVQLAMAGLVDGVGETCMVVAWRV